MVRKKRIFLTTLVILPILVFGLYVYKYNALAMEGWKLFNERCNNVNPALIKVRNTHLGLGAAMSGQATPSAEQFEKDLLALPETANRYLTQEKVWLDKQGAYINRWDFKLLEPEYIKSATRHQLAMYQSYYDYYKVVGDFFSAGFNAKATGTKFDFEGNPIELMDKYLYERNTNQDLYFKAIDKGQKIKDWRKMFAQVPEPNCPEENMHIPEYYSPSPTPQP